MIGKPKTTFTLLQIFIFYFVVFYTACTNFSNNEFTLYYETIYEDEKIQIREALLSGIEKSVDLRKYDVRIENTVISLMPGYSLNRNNWCDTLAETGWCIHPIVIESTLGQTIEFTLKCDAWIQIMNCELYNSDNLLWKKNMDGGYGVPLSPIIQVGNELVLSYYDISDDHFTIEQTIVITNGFGIREVSNAHYPYKILDKLLFFSTENQKETLMFDEKRLGNKYDFVVNKCCAGGPTININSNELAIDFFAKRDGNWYHVQAGSTEYLSSLK